MIIIGELINGMFKNVRDALAQRDKAVIQKLAKDQTAAGADYLDVNTGPLSKDPVSDMKWLVETIQEACDTRLCLDSTRAAVIEEGLALCRCPAMINSTSADDEKMERLMALARKHKARIIGLTMDKTGVPKDRAKRSELALKIFAKAMELGLEQDHVLIDPIVLPINVAQDQGIEVLEAIREFQLLTSPAPHTVIGLSNVSQGCRDRSLVNRTFAVMAVANGLSAAILDPLDKELVDAIITARLILNKNIYCDSYIDAYRKR